MGTSTFIRKGKSIQFTSNLYSNFFFFCIMFPISLTTGTELKKIGQYYTHSGSGISVLPVRHDDDDDAIKLRQRTSKIQGR